MWSAKGQAEGLTLRVAENKTGYSGVNHQPGYPKPYQAYVSHGGKKGYLGCFATAEEAALCVARSPEGKAAAERAAMAAPVPLTSEEAWQQAKAEGLTLCVAENGTGYFGVHHKPGRPKPYQAQVKRGGKKVSLGSFATAEEAALCVARSPEPEERAAAGRAAAPPLTREEVAQQAQAEGLTLRRVTGNKTGYFGVNFNQSRKLPKPYTVQVSCGGKQVYLGSFATVEEAALCVARSPEGQAAAERAAAAPAPLASDNGVGDGAGMKEGETETVEQEEEEEATIQVLDAIEVDPWTATDDDDVVTMPP